MEILGIDIGGTGIKGAPVDLRKGKLLTERHRIPTPQPALPDAVAATVRDIVRHFKWKGPVGCTFPAVVKNGVALTASNVDKSWIGTNGQSLIERASGCPVAFLNDADAAGLAEMRYGAGKGVDGIVIIVTLGTGIGSAVFYNGILVPNTEFGHMRVKGEEAEDRCSEKARVDQDLSWKKWAKRIDEFLERMEILFSPDLFIIGGGVSKKHEEFIPFLERSTPVVPALMLNDAGIVGAAMAAAELPKRLPDSGKVKAGKITKKAVKKKLSSPVKKKK